jgi:hypothetical protein
MSKTSGTELGTAIPPRITPAALALWTQAEGRKVANDLGGIGIPVLMLKGPGSSDAALRDTDVNSGRVPPALNPRWSDAQQRVVWKYNAKDVRAPERHTTAPQPVVAAPILTPEQAAPVQIRPLGGQETLVSLLANVRAPEVLATRRRPLQLRLGAVLSAMPAAAISFDPALQPFEQIAEVASEWVLRASS